MDVLLHLILLQLVATVLTVRGDIGEKIRLGLPVTPPDSSRNQQDIGLDAPLTSGTSTAAGRKKFIIAVPHNTAEEFNLEKLCNDPFHSFLCKPTVPRKRRIDGRLRPGVSLPEGFAKSNSGIVSGSDVLSANLEPANSDANLATVGYMYERPEQSVQNNVFSKGFRSDFQSKSPVVKPSNEYLPSVGSPKPQATYNYPYSLPLAASTISPTSTSVPTITKRITTTQRIVSAFGTTTATPRALTGLPSNQVFNTKLNETVVPSTSGYQYTRPTIQPLNIGYHYKKPQSPVNSPSASNQVVSSVSTQKPSVNDYLPPKDSLSPRPSDSVQFQVPFDENEDVKSAPQNVAPSRTGSGVLSTGLDSKPVKKEKTHTLEELCKDAFHSFLCKPIDKPRRRIDGNIRPGANIPAHVLLSAGSNSQNVQRLPPTKSGGSVSDTSLDGYKYDKPSGQSFQTTNLALQYAPRPNFAKPLYTYQQALLNSSPSNTQPAIIAPSTATSTTSHSHSNPSVPCTCHQRSTADAGSLEPAAAQNFPSKAVTGYTYSKPSTPFTLPTTPPTVRPTGYTYPKPSGQPFALPTRPTATTTTTTTTTTTEQLQLGQQSVSDGIENNALPPSSQFEILKL